MGPDWGRADGRTVLVFVGSAAALAGFLASGNAALEAMTAADLVIRPLPGGVGLLEWHQIDRMRAAGRVAATHALPAIRELLER